MSTFIRSALIAAALLTSASAAMAAPRHDHSVPDQSDRYGGYPSDSTEGARHFWQDQADHG